MEQIKYTYEDIVDIIFREKKVKLTDEDLKKVDDSFQFLLEYSKDKVIYGINTGFEFIWRNGG